MSMEKKHKQQSKTEHDKDMLRSIIDNINEEDQIFIDHRYGPTVKGNRFTWISIHIEKGANIMVPGDRAEESQRMTSIYGDYEEGKDNGEEHE